MPVAIGDAIIVLSDEAYRVAKFEFERTYKIKEE